MTDYFHQAEQLLAPQPQPEPVNRLHSDDERAASRRPMRPADPVAAQVHAILAVGGQLASIAEALERLAGRQPSETR